MAVDMRADDRSGSPVIREKKLQAEGKWLRMQYQLMTALVIFATMAEAVMYFVLRELEIPMTSPGWYLLKYLAVPFGINVLLLLTAAISALVFALFYIIVYRVTSNAYYSIVSGAKE